MSNIQETAYFISEERFRSQNGKNELNIQCAWERLSGKLLEDYKKTIQDILSQNISQEEKEKQWRDADYYLAEKIVFLEELQKEIEQEDLKEILDSTVLEKIEWNKINMKDIAESLKKILQMTKGDKCKCEEIIAQHIQDVLIQQIQKSSSQYSNKHEGSKVPLEK